MFQKILSLRFVKEKESGEINGKPEKEGKAMLAMHHYLKESGRQAVGRRGIDKKRFCTKSRLCMSSKDLM